MFRFLFLGLKNLGNCRVPSKLIHFFYSGESGFGENALEIKILTSYSITIGRARKTWVVGSGGVKIAPRIKAPTIA